MSERGDKRDFRYRSIDNLNLLKINSGHSKSTSDDERKSEDKSESHNYHVLISQLHLCRFIYYLIKNSGFFCVSKNNRDKLSLLLFKHVLKNIKQLSDSSKNWFNL